MIINYLGDKMKNHICEHCGAIVKGDVCDYCGCPVDNPAPKIPKPEKTPKNNDDSGKNIKIAIIAAVSFAFLITLMSVISITKSANNTNSTVTSSKTSSKNNTYSFELSTDEMPKIEVPDIQIPQIEKPVFSKSDINNAAGIYPAGVYQIGVDIPEGKYLLISDMLDETGSFPYGIYTDPEAEDEVYFSWEQFSSYVVIEGDGYVSFTWATAYSLENTEVNNDPFSRSGTFLVGRDLPAGTYEIISTNNDGYAYYSVYSDIYKTSKNVIISGEISEDTGSKEITVEDGQYLNLIWAKLKK